MRTTTNLLPKMREQVSKLYSPEVQIKIEQERDEAKKKAFVTQRKYYDDYLHQLEIQNLQGILEKMKPLEAELNRAIQSLDNSIQSVNNAVNIISGIQSVSSIVARIVPIF
ncbi:hypothetical protein IQ247_14800 [Plectonema cf. radiosum LEGE 06105]|uniref:Uncharacterized protein n=1 Tax=Plectonema cf. radiosum LEGE 06105 TaxID=945769 RepID=A0A8J7F979_9CYAN|nr:hypothetical protein [Plectonema radiosum]MBE9213919.1 hypothetical protein [Plectonema cf. radiosum LEGE 06105]